MIFVSSGAAAEPEVFVVADSRSVFASGAAMTLGAEIAASSKAAHAIRLSKRFMNQFPSCNMIWNYCHVTRHL